MTNATAVPAIGNRLDHTMPQLSAAFTEMTLPAKEWVLMIAAGLVFGAMGIRAWLMGADLWDAPAVWRPWMLLDAPALFAVIAIMAHRRYRAIGTGTRRNPALAAWNSVGIAVAAMALAFGVVAWKTQNVNVMGLFTPMLFVLCGMAWWVAYHVCLNPALKWVALGNFVTATATALLIGRPELWLAEAAGLLLFGTVPGILGLRVARSPLFGAP